MERNEIALESLLPNGVLSGGTENSSHRRDILRTAYTLLAEDNDRQVTVPGLGEKRLADVLAAFGYIELRKRGR